MKLEKAAGCLLALMLMAPMLTMTGAVPTPKHSGASLNARGCYIAHFKSLSPKELGAFKGARDAFEKLHSLKNSSCSSHLFPSTRDLRRLQVWERPVALEAELALTLKVLKTMADSALGAVLEQPLDTLGHIHSKIQACILAQATADPRPRGRLYRWLHRLQEATETESRSCIESSVVFNLLRLLIWDLKCVAGGNQCA